jgi:3-oxoacid CoA-transferase subunit B
MAWTRDEMCSVTARSEFFDGCYVNLGIGMPTEVANFIPAGIHVTLQSENGMLGMGPFPLKTEVDPDLINAGKQTITAIPSSSYFDSAYSFAMIRGGHIHLSILGALQVSEQGDLANWTIPGKMMKGMGGAMDLVANTRRLVILMEHCTRTGEAKLLKKCNLPLTGLQVVDRIITELGIFDITPNGMALSSLAPGVTVDEVISKTEAKFTVNIK